MSTHSTTSTAWKPVPGDTITGRIEDISEHDAGYGRYPILELATDSGIVAVHAFHDVLKNELARLAPDIGDTVTLTYKGKHSEKGYHQYKVRDGDGHGRGINWSAYGNAETPAAPQSDVPSDFDYGTPAAANTEPPKGNSDVDDLPF